MQIFIEPPLSAGFAAEPSGRWSGETQTSPLPVSNGDNAKQKILKLYYINLFNGIYFKLESILY